MRQLQLAGPDAAGSTAASVGDQPEYDHMENEPATVDAIGSALASSGAMEGVDAMESEQKAEHALSPGLISCDKLDCHVASRQVCCVPLNLLRHSEALRCSGSVADHRTITSLMRMRSGADVFGWRGGGDVPTIPRSSSVCHDDKRYAGVAHRATTSLTPPPPLAPKTSWTVPVLLDKDTRSSMKLP